MSCQGHAVQQEEELSNYQKYRGKCKEMSEALCKENPELTLVRGHYYCPIWDSDEPHWWCTKPDGTIVDPTKLQFPSKGHGIYTPFNGYCECANCGKEILEEEATTDGRFAFCSLTCYGQFVGVY